MSFEYWIYPIGDDFDGSFLSAAATFLRSNHPCYERSNGALVVAPNEDERDSVVQEGSQDTERDGLLSFGFRPTSISVSMPGGSNSARQVASFVEWCTSRKPCRLDGGSGTVTLAEFLEFYEIEEIGDETEREARLQTFRAKRKAARARPS